jgi:hypothetical protein
MRHVENLLKDVSAAFNEIPASNDQLAWHASAWNSRTATSIITPVVYVMISCSSM